MTSFWKVIVVGSKVVASTVSEKERTRVSLDRSRLNPSSSGETRSSVKLVTCRAMSELLLTTGLPAISATAADV